MIIVQVLISPDLLRNRDAVSVTHSGDYYTNDIRDLVDLADLEPITMYYNGANYDHAATWL